MSQRLLGQRLGISQSEMSRWEREALEGCSVAKTEQWATALGAQLTLDLRVDGERPMTDARHAQIQSWLTGLLRAAGWIVEPEASFNHYGDRGRVDLLAYHPARRILLVVEIKTRIEDAQDMLGRLDIKRRVATFMARERRWDVTTVIPALIVREGSTARRRIAAHEALFASFVLRARAARAWLSRPSGPEPTGVLLMVSPEATIPG